MRPKFLRNFVQKKKLIHPKWGLLLSGRTTPRFSRCPSRALARAHFSLNCPSFFFGGPQFFFPPPSFFRGPPFSFFVAVLLPEKMGLPIAQQINCCTPSQRCGSASPACHILTFCRLHAPLTVRQCVNKSRPRIL